MSEIASRTILDNGIRVLSQPVAGVRSASVGVVVDAGVKDELPDERGYAHLLEHMLFQGTGDRDAVAIAEMMEIGGGAMGAFTARDYTVYHATVLDEYTPFALEVLGDMLCNSVIPDEALERQRSVILNEVAVDDNPTKIVNDLLKSTLWPDHPLGYPTAGQEHTLKAATRDSLLAFMNRSYDASRVMIAASGNVEHEQFVSQVRDSFWAMEQGDQNRPPVSRPVANMANLIVRPRDLSQVYFALAWTAPDYTSPDRYAWHVFNSQFGGGTTSHLYRSLREEKGMVYHIDSQYQAYGSAGALVVEGSTLPQTLIPVLAGTLLELMRMSRELPDPDRHHRAVQSLISQHLVSGDSAYVRMSRLGLQELYFGKPLSTGDVIEGLRIRTPEDVRSVAESLFNCGLPTIALVGPVSDELFNTVRGMLSDFGELAGATVTNESLFVAQPH